MSQILDHTIYPASLDPAEATVAGEAQKRSNSSGLVIVIHGKSFATGRDAAEKADATLCIKHGVVLSSRQAMLPQIMRPHMVCCALSSFLRGALSSTGTPRTARKRIAMYPPSLVVKLAPATGYHRRIAGCNLTKRANARRIPRNAPKGGRLWLF